MAHRLRLDRGEPAPGHSTSSTRPSCPQGFLGAIEDKPYKFDLAKAKALLAKAGVPDGFNVTMDVRNTFPTNDIAQAHPGQLGQGRHQGRAHPG